MEEVIVGINQEDSGLGKVGSHGGSRFCCYLDVSPICSVLMEF
jgi:hypothetical protein